MTGKAEPSATRAGAGPRIVVIGTGGAGGNAVNNMIQSGLEGVEFLVVNTDAQALAQSDCEHRIQIGRELTQGLGAGSRPDIGRAAAEESLGEILAALEGANMAFVTAGMGGGTGTGAAPVIARAAREAGILTVGVVTKPFHFEGLQRMRLADAGIEEFARYVDTLIVIPNQNLFRVADRKTTFLDAFRIADQVLHAGVRGVTDLMVTPGLINLDFADVRSVMAEMGKAIMGTGEAEGEGRALAAAEAAIANPLLDEVSMKGARGVLINITGGMDLTLFEIDEAANRVREEIDSEANVIFGSTLDETMNGRMRVSIVAAGIERLERADTPGEADKIPETPSAPQRPIVRVYTERAEQSLSDDPENVPEPEGEGKGAESLDESRGANPGHALRNEEGGDGSGFGASDEDAGSHRPSAPIFPFRARQKEAFPRDAARHAENSDATPPQQQCTPRGVSPGSPRTAMTNEEPAAPYCDQEPSGHFDAGHMDTMRGESSTARDMRPEEDSAPPPHEGDPAAEAPALILTEECADVPSGTGANPAGTGARIPPDDSDGGASPAAGDETPISPPRRRSGSIFGWIAGNGGESAEESFRKGDRYYHGEGVQQNLALAFKAYLRAAEMGHAAAQNRVGWMYEKGEGTEADHTLAVKWYRRAAEQDHVNAMNDLGYMYRQGWGVPQDYKQALNWFSKAAARYDSYAEYNMGQMYENGWGVSRDMDEAIRWFRRSAARGHEWAAKRLEELGVDT